MLLSHLIGMLRYGPLGRGNIKRKMIRKVNRTVIRTKSNHNCIHWQTSGVKNIVKI